MSNIVTTAWEDENLLCRFEDEAGVRCIHVEVKNFSPRLVKEWREVFNQLKDKCVEDGYTKLYSYTQNKKFIKLISKDFESVGVVESENKIYEVVKWELQ